MEDQYPTDPLSLITEAEDRYRTLISTEFALNFEVAMLALQLAQAKMAYAHQLVTPPKFLIHSTTPIRNELIDNDQEA